MIGHGGLGPSVAGWSLVTGSLPRRVLQTVVCALAAWTLAAGPAVAAPQGFSIQVSGVSAPVGMAADTDGNCYWVTDGSSRTTRTLVAVDAQGRRSKEVSWQAMPTNVKALAWSDSSLFVGDIGDPTASRKSIQVLSPQALDGSATSWRAWDLVYPDGPHDADAMAVSGRGNIYIVTRGDSPAIYRAPTELSRDSDNTLVRVASAPADVTDAVFLSDGKRIALRTRDQVTLVDAYTWKTLATAPVSPSGGDAISSTLSGDGLQLAGSSTTVTGMSLPGGSTSATPTPSASAAAPAHSDDDDTAGIRWGTLITLVASVLLAVAAAVVVYRAK